MTQIQNLKLRNNRNSKSLTFWSLDFGIWDLFVIWLLGFGAFGFDDEQGPFRLRMRKHIGVLRQ